MTNLPNLDGTPAFDFTAEHPIMTCENLSRLYGENKGFQDINMELYPGEILGIVGESGSGKSTLLRTLSGKEVPQTGEIIYHSPNTGADPVSLYGLTEPERRYLLRTQWGFVHQHPMDGLRPRITAGGNIGERLMGIGERNYGNIRTKASEWLTHVEIGQDRIDNTPATFSGGMQQRLQIACNLVTYPKLIFMDEPTGGLDVSVQARLLDTIRHLVSSMNIAVIIVTHDLGVARLLADRLVVMKSSRIVETGLTDQVLDDPQHAYTQLLVSSILKN